MSQDNVRFDLSGRTAVVVGAGSDIASAAARRLSEAGARVVLGDIDESRMQAAADSLTAKGGNADVLRTDVTSRADVEALVARARDRFGGVDVMLNFAGIIHDAPVADTRESDLDRVLAVNLKGTYFGCQAVIPVMREQGSGSIINMASSAGFAPIPNLSSYAISKAGIAALTKVLAREVGRHAIRVNAIAPGFVEGGMTNRHAIRTDGSIDEEKLEADRTLARKRNALRITGRPDDIADVALFLASDLSRYITGQVIHANGGGYMP